MTNPIEVLPYHVEWPAEFALLVTVLRDALTGLATGIEHVGSTSVPGLAAKPILDIDVIIGSVADLPAIINRLATLGYFHQGDLGIAGRDAFNYPDSTVPWDGSGRMWMPHHLYVCCEDSEELRRQIAFRDYLRAHPTVAEEYGRLKVDLAEKFKYDRPGYSNAKTAFILNVYRAAGVR